MVREHTEQKFMYLEHIACYVKVVQCNKLQVLAVDKQWEYLIGKEGSQVEIIFEVRVNKS